MMEYKRIGKRILEAREEAGLSQEELASKLGYTQSALSNYELGKRRLYLANLMDISKALDKPLSYFFEGGTMEPESEQLPGDETLREIAAIAQGLTPDERKEVLDYMRWRRDRIR